jgi:hypothetical protein
MKSFQLQHKSTFYIFRKHVSKFVYFLCFMTTNNYFVLDTASVQLLLSAIDRDKKISGAENCFIFYNSRTK